MLDGFCGRIARIDLDTRAGLAFHLSYLRFKIFLFAGLHLIPVCRVITGMAGIVGLDFHDLPLFAVNLDKDSQSAPPSLKEGSGHVSGRPVFED